MMASVPVSIELCGSCDKSVLESHSAILCDGKCEMWWHIDCAGITKKYYGKFNAIVHMKGLKWFCTKCVDIVAAKPVATGNSDRKSDMCEYSALFSIITTELENISKNNLVMSELLTELKNENKVIKLQLSQLGGYESLKESTRVNDSTSPAQESRSVMNGSYSDAVKTRSTGMGTCDKRKGSTRSSATVANRPKPNVIPKVVEIEQVGGSSNSSNATEEDILAASLTQDSVSTRGNVGLSEIGNSWIVKKNNRKRDRAKPIIGSRSDCESVKIKAVGKLNWIFVSRLTTDCTKDDILDFLVMNSVSGECVELVPKHASYKSFKIGVSSDLTSKLLDGNFWPTGTLVREFVFKSKPVTDFVASRTFLGGARTPITGR